MKQYTGMFIIRPTLTEEGYKLVSADIQKLFTDNKSEILEVREWGIRDMAYEIEDFRKGYYILFKVNATPEALLEYDRVCNIREDIMRHILVTE